MDLGNLSSAKNVAAAFICVFRWGGVRPYKESAQDCMFRPATWGGFLKGSEFSHTKNLFQRMVKNRNLYWRLRPRAIGERGNQLGVWSRNRMNTSYKWDFMWIFCFCDQRKIAKRIKEVIAMRRLLRVYELIGTYSGVRLRPRPVFWLARNTGRYWQRGRRLHSEETLHF